MARSISAIEAIDFEYANQLGCTIRQISRAELKENKLFAAVEPALVELNSPLARVEGSKNLVMATGIYGGETVFGGPGPAATQPPSPSFPTSSQSPVRKLRRIEQSATRQLNPVQAALTRRKRELRKI